MSASFTYPPSPDILQWLAGGQLGNRLLRSLRLWVLLTQLYGERSPWAMDLPQPFGYPHLRDRLFAPTHGKSDLLTAEQLEYQCTDGRCICHRTVTELLLTAEQSPESWMPDVIHLSGLATEELEELVQQAPFTTVHRSIRDDLKQLAELGWLESVSRGKYQCISLEELPRLPGLQRAIAPQPDAALLSLSQVRELLPLLEDISFIQPNLEVLIQSLWEQVASDAKPAEPLDNRRQRRIFIHLDYILSPEVQEQVDTYQDQLEQLWRTSSSGVVQFEYELAQGGIVQFTTYPVCLHYVRRAKYLSAWGETPEGEMGWHNYRLDRITSPKLTVLAWGDPQIPKLLREMRREGGLPTSKEVEAELEAAWGFNFYLPRKLLLLRFPRDFTRRYVEGTVRHGTFEPVEYDSLRDLVRRQVQDEGDRTAALQVLANRSQTDAYYRAWIREGDINVRMRLRSWRPNGEVILPQSLRRQMAQEATRELSHYRSLL
ncbi:TIGR03985 family CRISPR-associated protein [Laspinema olomoucense]|uniref:TIGR03985 family CRISPR-associated protein n=1 Tax=Laspinema olomoucense TaxID=3231600 RepID=UPI0021BB290E|nr:TIGR03985 family CRISPR-associated protein [Laspinema sp. D3c]MCT7995977.1 TIGR03985 family CRISPR-associated protein [Laspinema sp. D3c]